MSLLTSFCYPSPTYPYVTMFLISHYHPPPYHVLLFLTSHHHPPILIMYSCSSPHTITPSPTYPYVTMFITSHHHTITHLSLSCTHVHHLTPSHYHPPILTTTARTLGLLQCLVWMTCVPPKRVWLLCFSGR